MISYEQALELILNEAHGFGSEILPLEQSLGRILNETVFSDRDYPPFNRASMDGIALEYDEKLDISQHFTIFDTIFAGKSCELALEKNQCFKIMTGAAVPETANCVVRNEDCKFDGDKVYITIPPTKKFQNISRKGEDCKKEQVLIEKNQLITPQLMGLLATIGKSTISVCAKPTLSLVSTGDELIHFSEMPSEVQIRDSNSVYLNSFLQHFPVNIHFKAHVKDEPSEMLSVFEKALKSDITIISGGVSAGDADFVPNLLSQLGAQKVFHKVAIKPGKPLWFGKTDKNQIVFALPGNPVSVQIASKLFIEPFLRKCFGIPQLSWLRLPFHGERQKKGNLDEFFPAKIINIGKSVISPLKINGSGDIAATYLSDGLFWHPAHTPELNNESLVDFLPW